MMVTVEERASDGMFERLDSPRQRGHRQAEFDRRGFYRAAARDLEKGLHAAEGRKTGHNDRN